MFSVNKKLKAIVPQATQTSKKGQTNQLILDALKNKKEMTFNELLTCYMQKFDPILRKNKKRYKWKTHTYKRIVVNALVELSNISLITADMNIDKGDVYYKLTNIAHNLLFDSPKTTDLEKDYLLTWTYDIGDKQYRSYSWNDAKVQCLLTVDAALIAGVLFVLQLVGSDNITLGIIPLTLYAISFVLLIISIIICLIHSIPKMNSKLGNDDNLRTIIGIYRFPRIQEAIDDKSKFHALDKYCESIKKLNEDDIITMNAKQIVGMAKNNISSHKIIRAGVNITIISVIILLLGTIVVAIQNMDLQIILNFLGG